MERETQLHTLKTNGKTVRIKTYYTARERRSLEQIYHKNSQVAWSEEGKPRIEKIDMNVSAQMEDKTVELMVAEYDGSADKILDRILDERDEVLAEVKEIIDSMVSPKAKTSDTTGVPSTEANTQAQ